MRATKQLTFQELLTEHREDEQLAQLRASLPRLLREDAWYIHSTWCIVDHWWRWQCGHYHTGIKTDTFMQQQDAIDQAMRLAFFYELLPRDDWVTYRGLFPETHLTKLPTLLHQHLHDAITAQHWHFEFLQRHSANNP